MAVGVRDAFTGTSSADTFTVEADTTFSSSAVAVNRYTGERVSVAGYNRSYDTYDLGGAADTLAGSAGNDAFFFSTAGSARTDANGASVASSAHFTSVNIFVLGQGGDLLDLTAGSGGADSYATGATAYGDSSGPVGSGAFGADVLWGGAGADTIYGDADTAEGTAACGDDRLEGGAAGDSLRGDAFTLQGTAAGGDDALSGGAGNDTIRGDATNVLDSAACGDDVITGGAGNDNLAGDAATYTLHDGARGSDAFVFGAGSGQDTIVDFQPDSAAGGVRDVIRVSTAAYGHDAFADLTITGTTSAVVSLNGSTDQITLTDVAPGSLTAADFEFIA
jgi:Ca2+-binding RTX toxin-like protein